ncbi:ABC transporter ATP-binding protein [Aureibacillus halotolerans]|uniref:ATP-binding cassette subfamily B protein n=1 Tax=Aureibacillus halotolerans TaxID=1508390 RepID=A0A4R6TVB9_9BACI|nr:ABC transporter ATP-binding protein [Aureibacillus halotolerans]TDQ37728.1 ATP-binding cassette subfamily B protein [Aureibacillus halotolerans]
MKQLLPFLKPYKGQVILILIGTLAGILLELYLPTLMADVVNNGIVNGDIPYIIQTGGWMIACAVLAVLLTVGVSFLASRVSLAFSRDVRRELFVHVEHFSLEEFDKIGTSSLITRSTNDVKQVQDVLNMILRMMTRAPFMLIGGIIFAVSMDATLSIVFFTALPVLAGLIILIARKAIPLFGEMQKKTDRLNLLLRETLIGTRVVRAFNRVTFEKQRFNKANEAFRDTGIRVGHILAYMFPVMMLVMNITMIALIWFGAIRIDAGALEVGTLMAFMQYGMMIMFSLIMLSMAFVMIPRAQVSAKRILEVLDMQASIHDPANAKQQTGNGQIEFNHVTFRYPGAERPALDDVSFVAKPGETTAIIGSTGAGKTSLLHLIPRFYDVENGQVLIDGVDVRDMAQKDVRKNLGYVPQKASLFSGTIAENVRFGNSDLSDEAIMDALETAQASDFVKDKENGLQADISQAGANLSGGQKQRLSIARALARKPAIYLFDDSFSALDYKTDARLRKALQETTVDATILLVAQRVSTVENADQIIVLNEGKVAGIGTHQELLASNQIYQEIVNSQQSEGESA